MAALAREISRDAAAYHLRRPTQGGDPLGQRFFVVARWLRRRLDRMLDRAAQERYAAVGECRAQRVDRAGGRPRVTKVERDEFLKAGQLGKAGIGHLRPVQVQAAQMRHSGERIQTRIRDLGAEKIQLS